MSDHPDEPASTSDPEQAIPTAEHDAPPAAADAPDPADDEVAGAEAAHDRSPSPSPFPQAEQSGLGSAGEPPPSQPPPSVRPDPMPTDLGRGEPAPDGAGSSDPVLRPTVPAAAAESPAGPVTSPSSSPQPVPTVAGAPVEATDGGQPADGAFAAPSAAGAPSGLPASGAPDRALSPLERLRGLDESAPGTVPVPGRSTAGPPRPQPARPSPEPAAPTPAVIAVGDRPRAYNADAPTPAAAVAVADAQAPPAKRQGSFLRELPILLVIAIVLALLIKTFLVQAFFIPSGSMEQTLHIHDRVLVNKLAFHTGSPERGEIVVFNTAGTRFADPGSGDYVPCPKSNPVVSGVRAVQRFIGVGTCGQDDFIKRIIAGPGDTIKCCNESNQLVLNGKPLVETYLYQNNVSPFCEASEQQAAQPEGSYDPSLCTGSSPPVTVPAGMYWVMGDHRADSADSRYYGFVPRSKLVGRAFIRIWPPSRLGFLRVPGTFKNLASAATAVGATPALSAPALVLPLVGGRLLRRRRRRRRGLVRAH